jgi:predicted SnoaL-like aldol condensation-catalyzing enzyme
MQQNIKPDLIRQKRVERKNVVLEYFKLVVAGKFREGFRLFTPDCKPHNPFVAGSMNILIDAMVAANNEGSAEYPEAEFAVKYLLAEGDFLVAHTQLLSNKSNPNKGRLRPVHLFRFKGAKIVECWNVTQQVTPNMPNASGAF